MNSQVAVLPYQLPSFEQPVKGERNIKKMSYRAVCATTPYSTEVLCSETKVSLTQNINLSEK